MSEASIDEEILSELRELWANERSDEHDWEYAEMAMQEAEDKDRAQRLLWMPPLCQKCRWLDWYYLEDCSRGLLPIANHYCSAFLRDPKYFKPQWLWRAYIEFQYLLWAIYNACMVGIAEVEPTLRRHYQTGG